MQFLLMIYDDERVLAAMSDAEREAFMGRYFAFTQELKAAGALVAGDALEPVATATTVRVRQGKATTTDGPFAETKEQLGGYYLVEVPDLDAALGWAAKIPSAELGSIEVRPIQQFP